nr:GAF domain-containing protein [Vogesella sp. EB]
MSSLPLAEIRRRFFEGETLPDNSVPSPILHSWRRCLGLGLSAARLRLPDKLDTASLGSRQQENADWLQLARPAIDALFDSVVDDGHVVIVADRHGVILDQMGHPAFLDRAERVALLPGMDWREDVRGTNAIGTALVLGGPVRVRGSEHYLERNRQLSCTAGAIVSPQGELLGVVDVSGLPRKLGDAQQQQVQAAVRHIEQRLFDEQAGALFELRFAPDAATLTTPRCGRLGFDDDGVLRAANRAALSALGLDWPALGTPLCRAGRAEPGTLAQPPRHRRCVLAPRRPVVFGAAAAAHPTAGGTRSDAGRPRRRARRTTAGQQGWPQRRRCAAGRPAATRATAAGGRHPGAGAG